MKISFLKKLVEIVETSEIEELEVRKWWTKVRIIKKRSSSPANPAQATAKPNEEVIQVAPKEPEEKEEAYLEIKSPMVGTFYRAPSPGAKPYVEVGDQVEPGQVVCIIEAMKLMNEIQSEVSGTIAKVLVENAQPVEYGQVLFLVKPS